MVVGQLNMTVTSVKMWESVNSKVWIVEWKDVYIFDFENSKFTLSLFLALSLARGFKVALLLYVPAKFALSAALSLALKIHNSLALGLCS